MNNKKKINNTIRRISSILLLLFVVIQIVIVIILEADIDICVIEEIHEITGFIFIGLMLVHVLVYWKSLKSSFISKAKQPDI